ncbi:MAG: restriction endonuclease, partial [Ramlibacter sp.]|nr:restriction endonuclease [Ramlibacter sp.]
MARKKRQGNAEDIMDTIALLPWWLGVALAVASYVVLHWLATRPQPTIDPRQIGAILAPMYVAAIAGVMQFVAPILCLSGALVSFLKRKKRSSLVVKVTESPSADALSGMSWREFEMLVGEAFRLQGYSVAETGGSGPDGGIDLVLRKGSESFLVQCKQWKAFKVGVDVVRELYGVMAARGAAGGFVVTSGSFTEEASAFAQGRNVKLIAGTQLHGLLKQAKASLPPKPSSLQAPDRPAEARSHTGAEPTPQCPACNAAMVRR